MRRPPMFFKCQRAGCGRIKEYRPTRQPKPPRFCSRRCNGLANKVGQKAIGESVRRRQRAVLLRVQGLSPLEAFRLGYTRGLQSKLRQIRRRYVLVRKDRAGDLVRSLTRAVPS